MMTTMMMKNSKFHLIFYHWCIYHHYFQQDCHYLMVSYFHLALRTLKNSYISFCFQPMMIFYWQMMLKMTMAKILDFQTWFEVVVEAGNDRLGIIKDRWLQETCWTSDWPSLMLRTTLRWSDFDVEIFIDFCMAIVPTLYTPKFKPLPKRETMDRILILI